MFSISFVAEEESLPKFAFGWLDDKDTFRAGDIANIKIKVLEHADRLDRNAFKPILTVNGKMGNSSYVSGVLLDFAGDPSDWRISFTVITVGLFNVFIEEHNFHVFDSSMHFQVEPGSVCSQLRDRIAISLGVSALTRCVNPCCSVA